MPSFLSTMVARFKSSPLRSVLFTAVFIVVAGAIGLVIFNIMSGGGDDRPPILVADGSVDIKAQSWWLGNNGDFKDVSGNGTGWKHSHPAAGPKKFTVVFTGGSPTASCSNGTDYLNIASVKVTYKTNTVLEISARNNAGDDDAYLDIPTGATLPNPAWLRIQDGSVLHVELYDKANTLQASCDPAEVKSLQVKIWQKK